jgi:hypothetical protein
MSTEVTLASIPDCDLNPTHGPAAYDGATRMGPWAYMCRGCFKDYGLGLGTGVGQKLNLLDAGQYDWLLTGHLKAEKVKDCDSKWGKPEYLFYETDGKGKRATGGAEARISILDGRYLFDGQDMETEQFMGFVGLTDMVDDGLTDIPAEPDGEEEPDNQQEIDDAQAAFEMKHPEM